MDPSMLLLFEGSQLSVHVGAFLFSLFTLSEARIKDFIVGVEQAIGQIRWGLRGGRRNPE